MWALRDQWATGGVSFGQDASATPPQKKSTRPGWSRKRWSGDALLAMPYTAGKRRMVTAGPPSAAKAARRLSVSAARGTRHTRHPTVHDSTPELCINNRTPSPCTPLCKTMHPTLFRLRPNCCGALHHVQITCFRIGSQFLSKKYLNTSLSVFFLYHQYEIPVFS